MDPSVALMTPEPSLEACEEGVTRQMAIRLDPGLAPVTRTRPLLARRAALDPRHALSVVFPEPGEAHTGNPVLQAGMKATAAQEAGLLR